jgi:hypothetical protein
MMRDAIFIACADDLESIEKLYETRGIENVPPQKMLSSQRCRRAIPSADIVAERVNKVVMVFHKLDKTFITKKVLEAHENCMKHLRKGCLSDCPDVPLYFEKTQGEQATFQSYKVARGTNKLEGFHYYVANSTAGKVVLPEVFDLMLLEIVFRWNIERASALGRGPDLACYDLRTYNAIYEIAKANPTLIGKPKGVLLIVF